MGVLQKDERAQRVALAQPPAQPQQLDLSGLTGVLRTDGRLRCVAVGPQCRQHIRMYDYALRFPQ